MNLHLPKILVIPLFLFSLTHNQAKAEDTNTSREVDSLIEYASSKSKKGNFDLSAVAQNLLQIGQERNDSKARLYGLIYTGHTLAGELNDSVKVYYPKCRTTGHWQPFTTHWPSILRRWKS